jgi:hypothetical protein
MRRTLLSTVAILLFSRPLVAQSKGGAVLSGMGAMLQGYAMDKANRDARTADSAAYASRLREIATENARARRVDSIAWALYSARAISIVAHARDSLVLSGGYEKQYTNRAINAVLGLYEINPQATNAQITETIGPTVSEFGAMVKGFNERVTYTFMAMVDSTHMTEAEAEGAFRAASDSMWALRQRTLTPQASETLAALSPPIAAYLASVRKATRRTTSRKPL